MDFSTDHHMDIEPPTSTPKLADQIDWVAPPDPSEGGYELYTDAEGLWVIYDWNPEDPHQNTKIEPFYERWPPSRTSATTCAWICVDRGMAGSEAISEPREERVERLQHDFRELTAALAATGEGVTPEQIDLLAIKHHILAGKWLVYAKSAQIDQLWRRVVRMMCCDRGRGQVKVSTRKIEGSAEDSDSHVICVYVEDYTNRAEVDDLRRALRLRAGVHWHIGFKPDVYTHLGIYRGNEWRLRPSRYHDSDNHKKPVGRKN